MILEIDVRCEAGDWVAFDLDLDFIKSRTYAAMKAVFEQIGDFGWCPTELSVLLSNDRHIQLLNRDFRGKDKPTNILSFPALNSEEMIEAVSFAAQGGPPMVLGDLVLSLETIIFEANQQHKSYHAHVTHLLVHGLLHLMGYDHIDDEEAAAMEALEQVILKQAFQIDDPYKINVLNHNDHQSVSVKGLEA